jgi:hypothetical protein
MTATDTVEVENARMAAATSDEAKAEALRIRLELAGARPTLDMGIILADEAKVKPEGAPYRVLHGALGRHTFGSVVYASQLTDQANIDRLIAHGAIAPLEDEEEDDGSPVFALPRPPRAADDDEDDEDDDDEEDDDADKKDGDDDEPLSVPLPPEDPRDKTGAPPPQADDDKPDEKVLASRGTPPEHIKPA